MGSAAAPADVWWGRANELAAPAGCLSAEERARAERLLSASARRSFVAGRVLLRRVLGGLLNLPPEALRFTVRPGGKPVLEGGRGLEFSLSHSEGVVLLAVTDRVPVGADLERVRPVPEADAIAGAFFPPEERDAFLRLPAPRPAEAFFRAWTRLEAGVKATGVGWRGIGCSAGVLAVCEWEPLPGCVAAAAAADASDISLRLHPWEGMISCRCR